MLFIQTENKEIQAHFSVAVNEFSVGSYIANIYSKWLNFMMSSAYKF